MPIVEYSLPDSPPEKHEHFRKEVSNTLKSVGGLVKAAIAPLPTETGDGSYIEPLKETGLIHDLAHMRPGDIPTLIDLVKEAVTGSPVDDKTYLMERIIKLASELPLTSKNGMKLNDAFIEQLYNDLQHPPNAYLGEAHKYRAADGSFNNILSPNIGAANTNYARTVRPQISRPIDLPDAGDLFDQLMARDEFKPHPARLSSMLFYLGSIIIHDLFATNHHDSSINQTSSYLELSPLYGNNQEEQNHMRTFQDGKIKADCFSNKRVLGFPPGVGALLITFNRFHNYVVAQLAAINERGRFTRPKSDTDKIAWAKYDHDLFQTGRLITCGLYINCILKDYVRTILELNRTESKWDLDPRTVRMSGPTANGTPGNQVSAEFNLVYRWHAVVSKRDDEWTQEEFKSLFPGQDPSTISFHELVMGLDAWEKGLSEDPQGRPFANIQRSHDGTLNDDALVKILASGIEDEAGAFGSRNVPQVMRSVEILGIKQARSWNLATLNEFRQYFNLTKHETFESINSDPEVSEMLKNLYDHPDYVELYPGLVIEEAKPLMAPGSGLCTDLTISRAVLSDAVALVRGDRFYTIDYTPNSLTNWGFAEVASDLNVDSGHVFYKLFLRAFPNHFKPDSVYAHFPLVIPEENSVILHEMDIADQYNWDVPAFVPPPAFITSYAACKSTLEDQKNFKVTWGKAIKLLMHNSGKEYGADFMLSGDEAPNALSRDIQCPALYKPAWEKEVKEFYENITIQLLREHSYKIGGANQVDIVRDVGNLAQAHFAAEVFCLPLKTEKKPFGIYTERQLYDLMALVFTCIFYDVDPAKSFLLRQGSRTLTQQLGRIMEHIVVPNVSAHASGPFDAVINLLHKPQTSTLSIYGKHMLEQLLSSGLGTKDVIWSQILPTAGGMVANQGQLFAQCLDFYLSEEAAPHLKEIQRLSRLDTQEADDLLLRYFMEGSRIRSTVGLFRNAAIDTSIIDASKTIPIHKGQTVLLDLITASQDPLAFPEPEKVKLDRDLDSYIHYGWGPHKCLGFGISKLALTTMLKTIGKLENLRRAPGTQGEIKKVPGPGGVTMYMMPDQSSLFPYPTTMKVRWDGDVPESKK